MRIPIRLLIVALLLAEIAGFVVVGEAIGVAATLAIVLLAMVAGVLLLRWQGVTTLGEYPGRFGRGPPSRAAAL